MSCLDLLADVPAWLRWAYPYVYTWLVQHVPSCWGLAYHVLDTAWVFRLCQPLRRRWNLLMARRFTARVRDLQPDLILATHFFAGDVLAAARRAGWLTGRLVIVMTDLFPHRLWLAPEADDVVVGAALTRDLCRARGIPDDRMHVLGIPVGARFAEAEDRPALVARFHLDPRRRTILIAGGGIGVGPIGEIVRRLAALEAEQPGRLQLLVVCGNNHRLARELRQSAAWAMPVHVFGFVDTMPELMQVSDVLVTKAGGLTMMEALTVGLPMVFCGTIPGQERFNADYAIRHGAAVDAKGAQDVVTFAREWLRDPSRVEAMRGHARLLGRPNAAEHIVARFLADAHG